MAYFTQDQARSVARANLGVTRETAAAALSKAAKVPPPPGGKYDIFLSHCSKDAELIHGAKLLLEQGGRRVYVDWIDDPQLSRDHVTAATARLLRDRMRSSRSLIFVTSTASATSKWMPWELGYFDGYRPDHIAIMPLLAAANSSFIGQEYLGLYPVVESVFAAGGAVPQVVVGSGAALRRVAMQQFVA